MIVAFITSQLLALGIPQRFHKLVMWASLIALCAALVAFWLWQHDQKVIAAHDAKIDAQVSEKAADASEAANDADAIRRDQLAADQAATNKAITDAKAKDPEGGKSAAGPVTQAAIKSLRQRAMRDHGSYDKEE